MPDTLADLIERLKAEWEMPSPEVVEGIAGYGQEAVGPLVEVAQSELAEGKAETLLWCVSLLGHLAPRAAVPLLRGTFDAYADEDWLETIADAAGKAGADAMPVLMAIIEDPGLDWYERAMATRAAQIVGMQDPVQREVLAGRLRQMLREHLERADALEGDDFVWGADLVSSLADLRDPDSRELIRQAYQKEALDPWVIDEDFVDRCYRGECSPSVALPGDWLKQYRSWYEHTRADEERYRKHQAEPAAGDFDVDARKGKVSAVQQVGGRERQAPYVPNVTVVPGEPYIAPPRPGRNDPCWCGSGLKYKKCHLERDQEKAA